MHEQLLTTKIGEDDFSGSYDSQTNARVRQRGLARRCVSHLEDVASVLLLLLYRPCNPISLLSDHPDLNSRGEGASVLRTTTS